MDTIVKEQLELIANRKVGFGDIWSLIGETKEHNSLTKTLEAYFQKTGFKGEYRLAPLDSKLYAIKKYEENIEPEKPKVYSFYGENFRQGI